MLVNRVHLFAPPGAGLFYTLGRATKDGSRGILLSGVLLDLPQLPRIRTSCPICGGHLLFCSSCPLQAIRCDASAGTYLDRPAHHPFAGSPIHGHEHRITGTVVAEVFSTVWRRQAYSSRISRSAVTR